MDENLHHQPTEDECWAEFWELAGTYLANLLKSGWVPPERNVPAAA